MEAKKVDLERGWGWMVDGWALFLKSPVIWVVMTLIVAVVVVLFHFLPLLGPLAIGLLATMLAGGLIYGVSRLDGGGELEIMQLFQAFTDSTKTGPMLVLGVISLVAALLMGIIVQGLVGSAFTGAGIMGGGPAIQLSVAALLGMLILLLLVAVLVAMLAYAIPLVMLENVAPVDAIKFSVLGALRNWQPFLVFCVICAVLSVLSALTFGLGFLIMGPVIAGAWYQSYKELYAG